MATQVSRETPAAVARPDRLVSIDVLRGVAALMVLAHHGFWGHLMEAFWTRGWVFWLAYPFLQGFVGVHLFLVISGFCIHGRAARRDPNANPSFLSFWTRRMRRLYPPYLAAVLLTILTLVVRVAMQLHDAHAALTPSAMWSAMSPGGAVAFARASVTHVLMLFPFQMESLQLFRNPVFWTLALEEHLYLMYFMVPVLRRRFGLARTVWIALAVTLVWRACSIFGPLGYDRPRISGAPPLAAMALGAPSGWSWMGMGPARWFEWVLGAVAVELSLGRIPKRRVYTSIPVAVASAAAAMATQWFYLGWLVTDLFWGVCAFIVVNRAVELEAGGKLRLTGILSWLAAVGVFSYSLYLVHEPLVRIAQPLLLMVLPWPIALPLGLLPPIGIAWWFYRSFERPSLAWARAMSGPRGPVEAGARRA